MGFITDSVVSHSFGACDAAVLQFFIFHTDHDTAVHREKPSTGHTRTSDAAKECNLAISNRDITGIDDSEDDSEGDDSEDSSEDEDQHDGRENSTPWASSPPLPPTNMRNTTASSSTGSTWPSSTALESSSSDRMVSSPLSERPGKLPSVTKRRAQEASSQTTFSSTRVGVQSSSSANLHPNPSSLRQRFLAKEANIHTIDPPTSIMGESSSMTYDRRRSRDEFDPEPLEQDSLDLLAKYDKPEPRRHRTLGGVGVAEATATGDVGRQGRSTPQRANGSMLQHPQNDSSDMSSSSVGSSGRKRAAPAPLLPERSSRRYFVSVGNSASDPTDSLPNRSVSAAAQKSNTAPIDDTSRATAAKTFLEIRTTAKIKRHDVHFGCRANFPCRDHKGPAPVPRNPLTLIYRNTLSEHRRATLEEAEYILSQANCFWARRLTVLWAKWCHEHQNDERSQVEWLLGSYPELLVDAARKCCPPEVIMIE